MIMLLLITVLCSINVASSIEYWKLKGVLPVDAKMKKDLEYQFELMKHKDQPVPDSFDARQQWPHCKSIGKIVDQRNCGSCWAVSSASTMTDRWCIAKNETIVFSAEDLLTCCEYCRANNTENFCKSGGLPHLAGAYWIKTGVVSGGPLDSEQGCKPYSTQVSEIADISQCTEACTNSKYKIDYNEDKRRGDGMRLWLPMLPIKNIQIEVMTKGPVCFIFYAPEHLQKFRGNEVYQHPGPEPPKPDAHAAKIIGWGVENGVPYWLVANSWGTKWGMEGFFKIIRGQNELSMEEFYMAAFDVNSGSSRQFSINILGFAVNMIFCCYSFYLFVIILFLK